MRGMRIEAVNGLVADIDIRLRNNVTMTRLVSVLLDKGS